MEEGSGTGRNKTGCSEDEFKSRGKRSKGIMKRPDDVRKGVFGAGEVLIRSN